MPARSNMTDSAPGNSEKSRKGSVSGAEGSYLYPSESSLSVQFNGQGGVPSSVSRNNIAMIIHSALSGGSNSTNAKDRKGSMKQSDSSKSIHLQMNDQPKSAVQSRITLQFKDSALEANFRKFFVKSTLQAYRRTIFISCLAIFAIYIYAMIRYPSYSQRWAQRYQIKDIAPETMVASLDALCIKGYHCANCSDDLVCGEYHYYVDAIFLAISVVPAILGLLASYRVGNTIVVRLYDGFASIFIGVTACVAIIIRFTIVEPEEIYLPGLFLLLFLHSVCHGLQLRFVWSVATLGTIVFTWIVCLAIQIRENRISLVNTPVVVGCSLMASVIVIGFNLHRNESFHREQFLKSQYSMKVNVKLINQLKALQRSYTAGVVDFETPLEKSIAILRSLIADPSLSTDQFHSLEIVIQFLNSPQLLTPDFEAQLSNDKNDTSNGNGPGALDGDQKAWLFSEITKRRSDAKSQPSMSQVRRRRKTSVFLSLTHGDDAPDVPSIPISSQQRRGSHITTESHHTASDYNTSSVDEPLPNFSANLLDPYSYAISRYTFENTAADKKDLDFIQESYAGSLLQISRPRESKKSTAYNPAELQNFLMRIEDWNWPLFDFCDLCPGGKPLFLMGYHMFQTNDLFVELNLPLERFTNFLWKIQEGYRDLPYHNSIHASDVMHAMNYFVQFDQVSAIASSMDLVALYVASAVHDYDHPGVNNNFLISTSNPLAILYNDKGVLESYHVSSAFQLLSKQENNFLSHLTKSEWNAFREAVIEMVLATDLSQHYATLSLFKTRIQNSFNPAETKEDRMLLFKMLIKCADVSNPTKDFKLYNKWTNLVLEEWRTQGDLEKKMLIPVSPFMDRENPNVLVSSQTGFIDFIIVPMFDALHQGFMKIPALMDELEKNRQYWAKIKQDNAANGVNTQIKKMQKDQSGVADTAADLLHHSPNTTLTIIKKAQQHMAQEGIEMNLPANVTRSQQNLKPT